MESLVLAAKSPEEQGRKDDSAGQCSKANTMMKGRKITICIPQIKTQFRVGWFEGTSSDDIKETIGRKVFRLIEQNLGGVQLRKKEILLDFWLEDEEGDEIVLSNTIADGAVFTFCSNSFFKDISPLVYVTDDALVHVLAYLDSGRWRRPRRPTSGCTRWRRPSRCGWPSS
ncbi:unnamed protein product, partial [Heterosigma akashiwo]